MELSARESSTFEDWKAGAQKMTGVAENPGAGQNLGNDHFLGNEEVSQKLGHDTESSKFEEPLKVDGRKVQLLMVDPGR